MNEPTHLVVTVKRAKDLLLKNKNGVNEAYAVIELNKEKFATDCEKSNFPTWMTECTFHLHTSKSSQNVIISILNKRHGKLGLESDDLIGFVSIPLSEIIENDTKQQSKWYKLLGKKKDSKKNRGEVEASFKFITKDISNEVAKKSPRFTRFLLTGSRGLKTRRRSEDEDSGVGLSIHESRKSFIGRSCDDITKHSDVKTSSQKTSSNKIDSARGSNRHLSIGGNLSTSRALSVEVLHGGPKETTQVKRSNSNGTRTNKDAAPCIASTVKAATLGVKKRRFSNVHFRKHSLPDAEIRSIVSHPEICVNGSHVYTGSEQSLVEATDRSQSVVSLNRLDKEVRVKSSRDSKLSKDYKTSCVSSVYKPRSTYRLDVRELIKVSAIPEDQKTSLELMSHKNLVMLANHQQHVIKAKDDHIRELESYIDTLLLKVILVKPQLLDSSCSVVKR